MYVLKESGVLLYALVFRSAFGVRPPPTRLEGVAQILRVSGQLLCGGVPASHAGCWNRGLTLQSALVTELSESLPQMSHFLSAPVFWQQRTPRAGNHLLILASCASPSMCTRCQVRPSFSHANNPTEAQRRQCSARAAQPWNGGPGHHPEPNASPTSGGAVLPSEPMPFTPGVISSVLEP